jgi:hypothetical protein
MDGFSVYRLIQFPRLDEQPQPLNDLLHPGRTQCPNLFREQRLVDRDNLSYVHHTVLSQIGFAFHKKDIAGSFRPLEIRRKGTDDNSPDSARVEDIVLDHHVWVPVTGTRSGGNPEIDLIYVSLPDLRHVFLVDFFQDFGSVILCGLSSHSQIIVRLDIRTYFVQGVE